MKTCPNCGASLSDDTMFCFSCGAPAPAANGVPLQTPQYGQPVGAQPAYGYQQPAVASDPYDHTSEFMAQDVSENKVYAMLPYILGLIGLIITLMAAKDSPYAKFHARQAAKIYVAEILGILCSAILCIILIGLILLPVWELVMTIVKLIVFFQVCKGQAKEPPIVKSMGFLR